MFDYILVACMTDGKIKLITPARPQMFFTSWDLSILLTSHVCHSYPILYPCRYIRSERSIILVNFCLSILASNLLILVGQSQTLSKVSALHFRLALAAYAQFWLLSCLQTELSKRRTIKVTNNFWTFYNPRMASLSCVGYRSKWWEHGGWPGLLKAINTILFFPFVLPFCPIHYGRFSLKLPWQVLSWSPPGFLFSTGPVHCDCCLPAFLLLGVLLLGADRGVAVLLGRPWQNEATAHPQTFPMPRLGWAHTRAKVC